MALSCREFEWESWMKDLSEEIPGFGSLQLNQLALPGTHNSGSSTICRESTLSGGNADRISRYNSMPFLACFVPVVKRVTADWSKCQGLEIKDQLKMGMGIRYLDMRITVEDDSFFLCHAMTGECLEPSLAAIREFVDLHEKEIIIVDINHLYNMTDLHHKKLMDILDENFKDVLLFKSQEDLPRLRDMWSTGQRVLVLYRHRNFSYEDFPQVWPPSFIHSPWPNTEDMESLFERLNGDLQVLRPKQALFVSQCLLTPQGTTVVKSLFSGLGYWRTIEEMACDVMERSLRWLKESPCVKRNDVNIVIADFAESDFVKAVVNINRNKDSYLCL